MYRCELLIDGLRYRTTDDLENWDEIKASFKRNDYDGVVRAFSNKFSFVSGARLLLLKQYEENYLNAAASVIISTRNNSWLYNERFNCALNYSTLQDDGRVLSINAIDDSVASLIKAKKGTQYEYVVDGIKDEYPLYYDGMELSEYAKWISTGDMVEGDDELVWVDFKNDFSPIPLYVSESDTQIKNAVDFADQTVGDDSAYLLLALKKITLDIEFHVDLWIYYRVILSAIAQYTLKGAEFSVVKVGNEVDDNGNRIETKIMSFFWETSSETPVNKTTTEKVTVTMEQNEKIILRAKTISVYNDLGGEIIKSVALKVSRNSYLKISWNNRIDPVKLDLVSPVSLLNRLLKSINGGKDGLTGIIEADGGSRLDNCMLLAAESARMLSGAKIYTSFTKFANWMSSVFGYVYDINGSIVTFRHRSRYFSDKVVKTIKDFSDYEFKVNSSLVYSRLRIGYDKQDYDTVNGRDEFRFTNEYTTGINITDNKLEMISPYRADAYGIEFLVDKSKGETTDDSSDSDLFFVGAYLNPLSGNYVLSRGLAVSGVLSPSTMFNAMYSPSSMISANESFIGVSIEDLTFASSDGNSDVVIEGAAENRNIQITNGMFTVSEVSMDTSDIEIPDDLTGIVEFEYEGEMRQGYYKNNDYNFGKSESSNIILIVKR